MIKLSDYVMQFLVEHGIRNIYLVSGGGMMHLLDSVGRTKGLRYLCNHHEQASAICAESEARLTGRIAVCLVTTGPGATNGLSGAVGAWYDSVPLLVISGQVRTQLLADHQKLRQLGPQEVDIVPMARPVMKYVKTVMDPTTIRAELERAFRIAQEGRPGPVWLDIPLDVQSAMIDETSLRGEEAPAARDAAPAAESVSKTMEMIRAARRPLALCGNGVHLARAEPLVRKLLAELRIPAVATIGGMDLFDDRDPLFMGRCGPTGQRRANFALQNSDLLLCLGASLSLASIGFNTDGFAPKAKKIAVNIDPGEFSKRTVVPHLSVVADLNAFVQALLDASRGATPRFSPRWYEACERWKARYPSITPDYYDDKHHVNSYVFAGVLSDALVADDVIVTGNSLDIVSLFQAFRVKEGQRVYTNINYGAMGWDLPGAIGACAGRDRKRVVLVTGDGGIQLNLHELAQIRGYRLPIKLFVLSNDGYQSIRATQENFFAGNYVGSSTETGVWIPSFEKLAAAYELPFVRARNNDDLPRAVEQTLQADGPALCELMLSPKQERLPRVRSFRREDGTLESRPLEDMYPFLPREEIHENMHLFDGDDA